MRYYGRSSILMERFWSYLKRLGIWSDSKPVCDDDTQRDYSKVHGSNTVERYKIGKCYALLTGSDVSKEDKTHLGFIRKDLELMKNVLQALQFEVSSPCLNLTDISYKILFDDCINNRPPDLEQYSCCLFYFSGHGDSKGVHLSCGNHASYKDIILTFCGSSPDIPRIFIFDCCRNTVEASCHEDDPLIDIPPNVLVVFGCLLEESTYGCRKSGSYFTRKLDNKLRAFIRELSFVDIISQVTGAEIKEYPERTLNPYVICTLQKQLHFGEKFTRKQFTSKQEVLDNIDIVGQGIKVLICYSHNPKSAKHSNIGMEEVKRQRVSVGHLACRLESHGFSVYTDPKDMEKGGQWLKWYCNHIESDHYVLLVCSPAMEELFEVKSLEGGTDWQTKLVYQYCNYVYDQLVSNSAMKSKFILVAVDPACKGCYPLPFKGNPMYQITDDKQFNYDSGLCELGLDALVCTMAGINRVRIEQESLRGPVQQVTGSGAVHGNDQDSDLLTLQPGYKFVSQVPSVSSVQLTNTHVPQALSPPEPQVQQITNPLPLPPHLTTPPLVPNPMVPPPWYGVLPSSSVSQKMLLWLSANIEHWRFMASYLGMSRSDIKSIEDRDPGDLKEQCYQMFLLWSSRNPQGTYRDIGAAIAESRKNSHVKDAYIAKVQELLTE